MALGDEVVFLVSAAGAGKRIREGGKGQGS